MAFFAAWPAHAGPFDLEDGADGDTPAAKAEEAVPPPPPVATIKMHAYTLAECLALAERNHPNLWASRARLAAVHAQLDEARYTPYSYWSASSMFGVAPAYGGTVWYNAVPRTATALAVTDGLQPFLQFSLSGGIPLYTFGKIESIRRAAEAQVRYNEWDLERERQQVRMDVRRAFFGLMAARDGLYIAEDVRQRLDKAITNTAKKVADGDTSVDDSDRLRLEIQRDELLARVAEARRAEAYATAGLRFLTGVQTAFDIPDEPIKRPETPLGPVTRYLTAARLFRPDTNRARAGVEARRAYADFARAQFYPNLALGLRFTYNVMPPPPSGNDNQGQLIPAAVFVADWGLDFLPKNARVQLAESQVEEVRALERLALGGVAVEVENAYAYAVEAKTREENWERAEHRAKRWISSIQDAVDLGTKDERYIVEPLRAYVYARANHVQALMDFNVALSELARVTGWDPAAPHS